MKTRAITEGAIFCAITVILSLLTFYLPFFVILTFFIPVAMIILGQRQGFKVSILSSLAATLLLGLLIGPIAAIQLGMLLLIIGCCLGLAYLKNFSPTQKTILGSIGFAIFIVANILFYQLLTGVNYINWMIEMLETSSQDLLQLYQTMGVLDAGQLQTMEAAIENNLQMMLLTIPAAFILMPILLAMANIFCADLILKRLGYAIKGYRPLSELTMPQHLKVFLMLLLLGVFLVNTLQISAIPEIYTITISTLVDIVFFIMGMACVYNYLAYKQVKNKGIKILAGMMCIFLQPLITFLGIVDTYLDIRRIFRRETEIK